MLYSLARPFVFAMDAEKAHRLTIKGLRMLPDLGEGTMDPRLGISLAGIDFPSPVGLAPGFDKNAEVASKMLSFGFGYAEIGTVTPRPQAGNPTPRLFRLVEDKAVINRMGFNNDGADAVVRRLKAWRGRPGIIGANIGANKDSQDRIADYAIMAKTMAPLADYLTINISSPNTPGLRALQDEAALTGLLDAVIEARGEQQVPLFLKLAPDLEHADIDAITRIAIDKKLDALIIGNTTITRPALKSRHSGETGGLSGAPLADLALQRLKDFRAASGGVIPLIAVGGIDSATSAYERIRAGASLVQLYSALVYHGPRLAAEINRGLLRLLARDGLERLSDAIGIDAS
ncbi:quinone-dependent dihydroorotate dehydrogenase [Alterisphingorhabdus coralli]|uniref:Dihydroorotate dehydrogenase (quinone) n=1 Tax=Alterisphingorhabdus coralli TaxID=3071408 RepID=A0AA97FAQ6_9SPHN|nr:quinone-dependent dihydroorotate dehydrogenase [Parasphingorhabdus sp. SCSIO 66989]WOE76701.1 quinone-dependent dihydroorotate dehydrogenase [Parasphingorhabdus sp. SCSIO 66989]